MQIRVFPNDGVPIYLQIVNQIKYLIASRRLSPGDHLPPIRRLAEKLLVNPNTVARAYRELESAGILLTRQGSGVFVSDTGSPLAEKERERILGERIDALLTDAQHLNVGFEVILEMVRKHGETIGITERNRRK